MGEWLYHHKIFDAFGRLLLHTTHASKSSMQIEVSVSLSRKQKRGDEVARIQVVDIQNGDAIDVKSMDDVR